MVRTSSCHKPEHRLTSHPTIDYSKSTWILPSFSFTLNFREEVKTLLVSTYAVLALSAGASTHGLLSEIDYTLGR